MPLDPSQIGKEGTRLQDLLQSSVWKRISGLMGGQAGTMPEADLSGQYETLGKKLGSVERPIFDMNTGGQGMLTGGGGMVWGNEIPSAWQGLVRNRIAPQRPAEEGLKDPLAGLKGALGPMMRKAPAPGPAGIRVPGYKRDLLEEMRDRRGWDARGPVM